MPDLISDVLNVMRRKKMIYKYSIIIYKQYFVVYIYLMF